MGTQILSVAAPFWVTSRTSSLLHAIAPFAFGALLMESKLQSINAEWYVTTFLFLSLTPVDMQASLRSITIATKKVYSLSYDAESGIIVVGLEDEVQVWQTAPYIAPYLARLVTPSQMALTQDAIAQGAPPPTQDVPPRAAEPAYVCVRELLMEAQTEAREIEASLSKADVELREHIAREQELIRSIEDLETKCAHRISHR